MYQTWSAWLGDVEAQPESSAYEQVCQKILAAAQPAPGETVVDVGAGLGLLTVPLAARVQPHGRVIAIEPAADCQTRLLQLQQAWQGDSTIEVRAGQAEALNVDSHSCDLLITRSVLIYVVDKRQAFREFARVLKPTGRMVCYEPINHYYYRTGRLQHWFDLSSLGSMAETIAAVEQRYFPLTDPMCNFTEQDLLDAAEAAGFCQLTLQLERHIAYRTMTLDEVKQHLGWDHHLAPTYPTLHELLSEHLSPAHIDQLLEVIEHQLPGRKVRTEGAVGLLTGYIGSEGG